MKRVDVAIIGGGIAGLAAAHRVLMQAPSATFVVLEASHRLGGHLGSARVAGTTLDTAADAFLARVEGAVDLATELGLGDDLIAPATGNAGVLIEGMYRPLPGGLVLGVPTDLDALRVSKILSPDGLAAAAADEVTARPLARQDRSIAAAIGAHLGAEVVARLVDPLLGGISAANCDDLSIDAAAPSLAAASWAPHLMQALREQQVAAARGQIGITETRPVFLAPKQGVHTIVDALRSALGDRVHLDATVESLTYTAGGRWTISVRNGESLLADAVIMATPALVSSSLLAGLDPLASQTLEGIRMASVALVLLAYRTEHCRIPSGSGVLVPRHEGRFVTAASWWNHKWPHLNDGEHTFIRASVGRIDDVRFHQMTDAEIVQAIHGDLSDIAALDGGPVDAHVARWMGSFPQYDVGHLDRVAEIERSLTSSCPRVFLAGAALRGVGMPACIRSGRAAADLALSGLALGG